MVEVENHYDKEVNPIDLDDYWIDKVLENSIKVVLEIIMLKMVFEEM